MSIRTATCLGFSPTGMMLAVGTADSRVWLWDVASKRTMVHRTGHPRAVGSLAFSPDGASLATGSLDGKVQISKVPQIGEPIGASEPNVLFTKLAVVVPDGVFKQGSNCFFLERGLRIQFEGAGPKFGDPLQCNVLALIGLLGDVDIAVLDIVNAGVQTRPVEQVAQRIRRPELGVVAASDNASRPDLIDLVIHFDVKVIERNAQV